MSNRAEANRLNALLSTGPKTPEGKAKVSINALKHGLTGNKVVVDKENQRLYKALKKSLQAHYKPDGLMESYWTERILISLWRQRRSAMYEANSLTDHMGKFSWLPLQRRADLILKYEAATSRELRNAVEELERLQKNRLEQISIPMNGFVLEKEE